MFISPAYAQGAGGGGFDIMTLLPLVLIFVVFYFLLIRPQQKKVKDDRTMLGKLQRGDKVVTNGGIVGQIRKVISENELDLEIANGVRVSPNGEAWVQRSIPAGDDVVYDVFDADGRRTEQVVFLPQRRVVGFAGEFVYVVRRDEVDLFWLERYMRF